MTKSFYIDLRTIQPSQLYVSEKKLDQVKNWFAAHEIDSYEPLPLKEIDGVIFFTDGHTRALMTHLCGIERIKVYWDDDDLDWEAYQECVRWCIEAGITSIKDLADKIIPHEEYEKLWIGRCDNLHEQLEIQRERLDKQE